MIDHAILIWKTFVLGSAFRKVHIIAHQRGGECLIAIQEHFKDTFYKQAGKIVMTSCKAINYEKLTTPEERDFMQKNAINYISSLSDLGDLNMGLDL